MRSSTPCVHCVVSEETASAMSELGRLTSRIVKRGGMQREEQAHLAVLFEEILWAMCPVEESHATNESPISPTPESEKE